MTKKRQNSMKNFFFIIFFGGSGVHHSAKITAHFEKFIARLCRDSICCKLSLMFFSPSSEMLKHAEKPMLIDTKATSPLKLPLNTSSPLSVI